MNTVFALTLLVLVPGQQIFDDFSESDALLPEQIRMAIAQLNATDFHQRESAANSLFKLGVCAVPALKDAAENGSPEVMTRSFDILQRLYVIDDENVYEPVDKSIQQLLRSENLPAALRADRLSESIADLRQSRAVARLENLGAIVINKRPGSDSRQIGRVPIHYVLFGRNWTGGNDDFRLISRIDDFRLAGLATVYVVRGSGITMDQRQELAAELPWVMFQERGPAMLGVSSAHRGNGCFVDEIVEGTAAEQAGLKKDDQIIEISGKPVDTFQDLVDIISDKVPGEVVPIVFLRQQATGQDRMTGEGKLTGWARSEPQVPIQNMPMRRPFPRVNPLPNRPAPIPNP